MRRTIHKERLSSLYIILDPIFSKYGVVLEAIFGKIEEIRSRHEKVPSQKKCEKILIIAVALSIRAEESAIKSERRVYG
jgi:hypothetical protein